MPKKRKKVLQAEDKLFGSETLIYIKKGRASENEKIESKMCFFFLFLTELKDNYSKQ